MYEMKHINSCSLARAHPPAAEQEAAASGEGERLVLVHGELFKALFVLCAGVGGCLDGCGCVLNRCVCLVFSLGGVCVQINNHDHPPKPSNHPTHSPPAWSPPTGGSALPYPPPPPTGPTCPPCLRLAAAAPACVAPVAVAWGGGGVECGGNGNNEGVVYVCIHITI